MSSFTAGSSRALGWTTMRSSPTADVVWEEGGGGRVGKREGKGKEERGWEGKLGKRDEEK